MISRCPSCAAEVDETASRCSSCGWDFELRQRIPPAGGIKDSQNPPAKAENRTNSEEETPSPEPPLPAGAGLKQFGKAASPPPPKRDDVAEKSGFSIPVLSDVKKEEKEDPGPPATEVRRLPPEKTPIPAGKEKIEKEKTDAAERFKKRGKTQPKIKETARLTRGFQMDPKLAAAIVALLLITLVGAYLSVRPERPARPSGEGSSAFVKGSKTVKINPDKMFGTVQKALSEGESDRDIRKIQRVGVDPLHPEAGLIEVTGKVPAPAPPPMPPAPPTQLAAATWVFEGQIYDLITLQPVRGAKISFKSMGEAPNAPLSTDAQGRFKATVPALTGGGYELSVNHGDYLDGYIDEMSPPLREADLDERRMLAGTAVRNAMWIGKDKGRLKRDFYLIPKIIPANAE